MGTCTGPCWHARLLSKTTLSASIYSRLSPASLPASQQCCQPGKGNSNCFTPPSPILQGNDHGPFQVSGGLISRTPGRNIFWNLSPIPRAVTLNLSLHNWASLEDSCVCQNKFPSLLGQPIAVPECVVTLSFWV